MISYNDAQSSGQRMVFQNGKWKFSGEILAIIIYIEFGRLTNIVEPCTWCTPKFLEPF